VKYRNKLNGQEVGFIGETVMSHIADDPSAEHISMTHYGNGNVEVAFRADNNWIANNALGVLVIFRIQSKHYYLPKSEFYKQFEFIA
jgi:hypothetical protein